MFVCLLERNSCRLLERRNTAVANTSVCSGNVLDQMLGSNQVTNTPAGSIEGLARRSHGKGALVKFRRKSGNSSIRNIEKAVIYFIRQDDQIVLDAQVTDTLQLLS